MLNYVKFEVSKCSFEYPSAWQLENQSTSNVVITGPSLLRCYFNVRTLANQPNLIADLISPSHLLSTLHKEKSENVTGEKLQFNEITAVFLKDSFLRDGDLFESRLVTLIYPQKTEIIHGSLGIVFPQSLLEVAEPIIQRILDSLTIENISGLSIYKSTSANRIPITLLDINKTQDVLTSSETNVTLPPTVPNLTKFANNLPVKTVTGQASVIDPSAYKIKTIAGGGSGLKDGPPLLASFHRPNGITADPQGNLYIADFGNNCIRRISIEGMTTTLAGRLVGYRDEPGTLAMFDGPRGIVYSSGYLYVADLNNAAIRRVTLDGTVKTTVGNGTRGINDGIAQQAQFEAPRDLAVDKLGNIFVADGVRIRRITPDNRVQTIAGSIPGFQDGPLHSALFGTLGSITIDQLGSIYVADVDNKAIRKITLEGQVSTISARSKGPIDIVDPIALACAEDGALYVIDAGDYSIKCLFPDGSIALIAGTGKRGYRDGTGGLEDNCAEFWSPTGLAIINNKLYVTDRDINVIRTISFPDKTAILGSIPKQSIIDDKLASSKSEVTNITVPSSKQADEYIAITLAGGAPGFKDGNKTDARFSCPIGLCLGSDGTVYVTDHFNNCIRGITPDGTVLTLAGSLEGGLQDGLGTQALFKCPLGIAIGPDGNIYIADHLNYCIRTITTKGQVKILAGNGVSGFRDGQGTNAQFEGPKGIAVSNSGLIFVTDAAAIRCIEPTGRVFTIAGGKRGNKDGRGTDAAFGWPYAVAVDANGDCYVTDAANHSVRKITPNGYVTTIFGGKDKLNFPSGIAIDITGVIYVADTNNHRILRLDQDPINSEVRASLICGSQQGLYDGIGSIAKLNGPQGIGLSLSGELYVADSGNNRIVRIVTDKINAVEKTYNISQPITSLESQDTITADDLTLTTTDNLSNQQPIKTTIEPSITNQQVQPESNETLDIVLNLSEQQIVTGIFNWEVELIGDNTVRTDTDKTLYINTCKDPSNSAFFFRHWNITSEDQVTVEAKMQLISYSGDQSHTGCAIWIENDLCADALIIYPTGIKLLRAPDLFHPCDTITSPHTYKIVTHNNNIKVLVDGILCIDGSNRFWLRPTSRNSNIQKRRWIAFGDGSSSAGSESRWYFVNYEVNKK